MTDAIDKRVSDLEDLLADIPQMLSLRLEGITAAQQESTARIGFLDKQMAMLIRDVRDMRSGLTRYLKGQDERLAAQDERLGSIEQRLVAQDSSIAELHTKLDKLLSRLP